VCVDALRHISTIFETETQQGDSACFLDGLRVAAADHLKRNKILNLNPPVLCVLMRCARWAACRCLCVFAYWVVLITLLAVFY
jgi:hypothetical protein